MKHKVLPVAALSHVRLCVCVLQAAVLQERRQAAEAVRQQAQAEARQKAEAAAAEMAERKDLIAQV